MRLFPIVSAAAVLGLVGVASYAHASPRRADPPVVPHLDLDRYLGRWYEIAHLPAFFQRGCVATTATYALRDDGDIEVVNRCRKGGLDGKPSDAKGKAWVVDEETNAKLKVQFFWPFSGDYWVLALDDDYRWALVGSPDRDYLWILSRTPQLPEGRYEALVNKARDLGYPVEKLIVTPQPGAKETVAQEEAR